MGLDKRVLAVIILLLLLLAVGVAMANYAPIIYNDQPPKIMNVVVPGPQDLDGVNVQCEGDRHIEFYWLDEHFMQVRCVENEKQ